MVFLPKKYGPTINCQPSTNKSTRFIVILPCMFDPFWAHSLGLQQASEQALQAVSRPYGSPCFWTTMDMLESHQKYVKTTVKWEEHPQKILWNPTKSWRRNADDLKFHHLPALPGAGAAFSGGPWYRPIVLCHLLSSLVVTPVTPRIGSIGKLHWWNQCFPADVPFIPSWREVLQFRNLLFQCRPPKKFHQPAINIHSGLTVQKHLHTVCWHSTKLHALRRSSCPSRDLAQVQNVAPKICGFYSNWLHLFLINWSTNINHLLFKLPSWRMPHFANIRIHHIDPLHPVMCTTSQGFLRHLPCSLP